MILELVLESHPCNILIIGPCDQIPAVDDFVERKESGWIGYVKRRKWTYKKDGTIIVRCWLRE